MKSAIACAALTGLMFAGAALAVELPPEVKKLRCDACHALDHKMIGPAWRDVAAKYKGQASYRYSTQGSGAPNAKEYPLVEGLVMKVSRGGAGNWGGQPMVPNNPTGAKNDDIRHIVEFVLGLAN